MGGFKLEILLNVQIRARRARWVIAQSEQFCLPASLIIVDNSMYLRKTHLHWAIIASPFRPSAPCFISFFFLLLPTVPNKFCLLLEFPKAGQIAAGHSQITEGKQEHHAVV